MALSFVCGKKNKGSDAGIQFPGNEILLVYLNNVFFCVIQTFQMTIFVIIHNLPEGKYFLTDKNSY